MAGGSIKAETVRNDRQPWDSLPALMMADGKERGIKMTKKEQYENHRKTFLEIRDLFLQNHENFALAKAFHKPMKFYGEHTKNECVEILRKEANA